MKITGGARIGMAKASWPFATLKVTNEKLVLNATIIGNLVFQPSDIIEIVPYSQIPILGKGIKIHHNVETYKETVIFWSSRDPNSIIAEIEASGFLNNQEISNSSEIDSVRAQQKMGGFPIKRSVAIIAVVLWNLLFLTDFLSYFQGEEKYFPIGNGIIAALGLVFCSALLSLLSSDFRNVILKEGRTLEDIKKFAIFAMIITGFMLFNFILLSKMTT